MTIKAKCPQCYKRYKVPAKYSDSRLFCPSCGVRMEISDAKAVSKIRSSMQPGPGQIRTCSQCGKKFQIPPETSWQRIACPHCKTEVLPDSPEAAAQESSDENWLVINKNNSARSKFLSGINVTTGSTQTARKARLSRYRTVASENAIVKADCVIHELFCEEDSRLGYELAEKLKGIFDKEECFKSTEIEAEPQAWGRLVTISEGFVNFDQMPGKFLQQGLSSMSFKASIFLKDKIARPISAAVSQRGADLRTMRAMNLNSISKKVAKLTIQEMGFYKHLYKEVSNMATATCILGLSSAIPFSSCLIYPVTIILAIITLVYNKGREHKIGIIRVSIGLIAGGVLTAIWFHHLVNGTGPFRDF
jgi:RNase P subunit RPR2